MSKKLLIPSKMARKLKNSRNDENYYIVFNTKLGTTEEIREELLLLGCSRNYKHLYFWPEDLLCSKGCGQLSYIHADIIHTLLKKPEGIKSILKPNRKKMKEWEDNKMTISDDIIEKAKMRHEGIKYVKGSDCSSSALILRIDSLIDPKGQIRKTVNELVKEIENIEQGQRLASHVDKEEISGDDSQAIPEDIGELPEDYKMREIEEKPLERTYHPPQICLANDIVDRIKAIYRYYHDIDMLSRFKKFDFIIYTVNINMLEDQTWLRLSRKESECFPDSYYEGSDGKARKIAKEKVFKYNEKTVGQHENFHTQVKNNPTTLFLIVADEAHWGATTDDKPHSMLINKWNSQDHPNVILLLVTATPYNLLTQNSRLPTDTFFKKDKDGFRFETVNVEKKTITQGFKMLHRVKWTESFRIKVEEGIIVKLKVPIHGKEGFAQLHVEIPDNKDNFLPWNGQHSSGDNNCINEFLMKGHEDVITLSTINEKWTLSVMHGKVGFIHDRKQNYKSNFCLINTFGEGLLVLMVTLQNSKKLLAYHETSKRIELVEMSSEFDSEYDVPPLNSSFLLEECRPAMSLDSVREYISVNYYINSMRNNVITEQLIRNDPNFEEMVDNLKTTGRGDDYRTSEYSYFIIIINAWRDFPFLFENIRKCFETILQCAKDFQEKRKEYINKFKDELEKEKSQEIRPVDVKRFEEVLNFYAEKVDEDFKDNLKQFQNSKSFSEKNAENLVRSGILCLLHLDGDRLQDVQKDFDRTSEERKKEFYSYADQKKLSCSDVVENLLQTSETGRIVHNLIPKDLKKLNGTMNIIRTSTQKTGNQLYKTLCIARRISSVVDYSFEILRDYSNAKLVDDFNDKKQGVQSETTARYRLRERLQPKRCTYIDEETFTSCQCIFKSNEQNQLLKPTMKCRDCKHVHKKIESYEDLDGLPCILILIQKGRLGDTFPPSMNALDIRLCNTRRTRSFYLSQFVQEIGRLCRYQNKSKNRLPYALTSTNTADILRESIQGGATYFSVIESPDKRAQLDPKLHMERKRKKDQVWEGESYKKNIARPTKNHYDYNNTDKHGNRILLGAEPQIGKTGVYLKVISILQRLFSSTKGYNEEEMEEDEDDDISDETDDLEEKTEKCKWIYPYWKDIHNAKNLVKRVNYGKYTRLYGIYEHRNQAPEIIPRSIFEKKPEKRKRPLQNNSPSQISRPEINKFKSFNYMEHTSCTECSFQYESDIHDIILHNGHLEDTHFRLSVPRTLQYLRLLESVKPYAINEESGVDTAGINAAKTPDVKTLNSWIFIPSYNRYNRANINMYHTMVQEKDGNYEPCFYTVIIVVRSCDFEAYCKLWQSMYAVLQIPDKLYDAERDAMSGGIGFARRCIQVFAESLKLKWIFMLDEICL
ncbi:uncharacterized protein [Palaemon carinicauda]|uniref:uncharacterized protein n=1 Tax=Palaemon carinicauda TaxID=392227 RepID=UPI0035B636F4